MVPINERKDYLHIQNKATVINIMKIRLNMIDVKNIYKGKYKNDLICPICKRENDTTEHLFQCTKVRTKMTYVYDNEINIEDLKSNDREKLQKLQKYAEEAMKLREPEI